jgi:hypothetical protein
MTERTTSPNASLEGRDVVGIILLVRLLFDEG